MTEAEIIANLDGDITALAMGLREAEARCDEYVAQNMRQAQRLAALEEAARDVVECLHGDEDLSRSQRDVLQRLVEVLDSK